MTQHQMRRIARVVSVLVATVLLGTAIWKLDIGSVTLALTSVRPGWIVASIAVSVLILPLWALQWMILAPPGAGNRLRPMVGVVAISSAMHNTAVAFVGEGVGVAGLVTRIGLEPAAAFSVLAMDQLLVGLAKLALVAVAARLLPLPAGMVSAATIVAVGATVLLAATLALAFVHEPVARVFSGRAAQFISRFGQALAPLRSPRRFSAALVLAGAKLAADLAAIVCVQRAFGVDLPVASAVLALVILGFATALPVAPANLGTYEASIVVAYTAFGIPAEQALGMALVQHACRLVALAAPGYGWLLAVAASSKATASR